MLSIKTFPSGSAFYNAGGGHFAVDESSYLILNHGRSYAVTIESEVESFCIFFAPEFAADVFRSLTTKTLPLLDSPAAPSSLPIDFFEKTYRHDDLLSPCLFQLRSVLRQGKDNPGWLAEQLHEVMRRMVLVHRESCLEAEALSAVRKTTREELYRRLHRARDFMASSLHQHLTLNDVAKVACLSPNHLLRTFRQLFEQSPYQYLTGLRLKRAQGMLVQTNLSVTEICSAVGFESSGSFSWLFRRRIGFSPESYRREKGDIGEAPS